MRMAARLVTEQKGRMRDTVDRMTLGKGIGNTWSEVDYAQLIASAVTETSDILDNAEQVSDTLRSIAPNDSGIHMLYTDRVADRIFSQGASIVRSGILGMNAILRLEDLNGIVTGRAATTDLGTAGNPLTSNLVRAARYRITSNVTEQGSDAGALHMQHHGFVLKDIDDELVAAVGTYPISGGITEQVFAQSYVAAPRAVGGVIVHENGHLTIDASDDSEGFVYATMGVILVEGRGIRTEVLRRPNIGGGATSVFIYYEYAWGERSAGNWLFSLTADALAPA